MGVSGYILSTKAEPSIEITKRNFCSVLDKLGYNFSANLLSSQQNKTYCFVSVSEYRGADDSAVIYLDNDAEPVHDIPCLANDEHLYYRIAYIEDVNNCMDILLKTLFLYSKNYPEICFYVPSTNNFYGKEDIAQIYFSHDWTEWCYRATSTYNHVSQEVLSIKAKGHAEVGRRGVCCLVIGEDRSDKYAAQLGQIIEFIKLSFVKSEVYDIVNFDYDSKRCKIMAKLNTEDEEYVEVDVIEKWDPINDGVFDDVGQDVGIHLVLKYTKGYENIIKVMLKQCYYGDETMSYVLVKTKKALTISEFCD